MKPERSLRFVLILSLGLVLGASPFPRFSDSPFLPVLPAAHAIGGYDEYFAVTPFGTGEAYGGSYGDISSVFWNPAGIGAADRFQFSSLYTDLYGLDIIKQTYLGFLVPWGKTVHGLSYATNAISYDFSTSGLFSGLGTLEYKETTLAYSIARSFFFRNFYLGANLKYYDITSNLTEAQGQGSGSGLDIGALLRMTQNMSMGFSVKNVVGSTDWKSGTSEDLLMIYRLGLQYEFSDKARVMLDVVGDEDVSFHYGSLGGEMWLWKSFRMDEGGVGSSPRDRYFKYLQTRRAPTLYGLAVRGGIKQDVDASLTTFSTGAGLRFGPLRFDYALRYDAQELGNTSFASLAFELGGPKASAVAPVYSQFMSQSSTPADAESLSFEQKMSISEVPTSTKVAVANFVNLTGRPDFAWLELGIADMIYNELLQRWDMIDRVEVAQKMGSQQMTANSGPQWAPILGANKIIFGFFSDLSDGRLRIDTYVYDTKTGKTRQTSVEKSPDEIYSVGTELAYKVFFL